ncbi:hypothetical protein Emag_002159 [Eimeria magna]
MANQTGSDASGGGVGGAPEPSEPDLGQGVSSTSTAPPTTTITTSPQGAGGDDSDGEHGESVIAQMPDSRESRRLAARIEGAGETVIEEARLLVCATTPAALNEGERPFT